MRLNPLIYLPDMSDGVIISIIIVLEIILIVGIIMIYLI